MLDPTAISEAAWEKEAAVGTFSSSSSTLSRLIADSFLAGVAVAGFLEMAEFVIDFDGFVNFKVEFLEFDVARIVILLFLIAWEEGGISWPIECCCFIA